MNSYIMLQRKGELFTVVLDRRDYEEQKDYRWFIVDCGAHRGMNKYYVRRHSKSQNGKRHSLYLHREIMGPLLPGQVVDHKDGNGLNCLRSNLRVTTQPDNARRQIKKTQRGK